MAKEEKRPHIHWSMLEQDLKTAVHKQNQISMNRGNVVKKRGPKSSPKGCDRQSPTDTFISSYFWMLNGKIGILRSVAFLLLPEVIFLFIEVGKDHTIVI